MMKRQASKKRRCIKLLHGTSSIFVPKIVREGLGYEDARRGKFVGSYLTNDPRLADYYAKEAVVNIDLQDGKGPDVPVILEVTVPETNLLADYISYCEPLTFYRDRWADGERDWHRRLMIKKIPFPKTERDWRTSLRVVRSVRHEGVIPPECIRRAEC